MEFSLYRKNGNANGYVDCNSLSIRKSIYSLNFKRTFYNNFPDEDKCILFTDSIISTITCHQEVQNERNGVIILYLSTAYTGTV